MPSETRPPAARRYFSRNGLLSQWHPRYEFRPGQIEMAEQVEAALADRKHLIVEAGTGTGKTLAYLIPALLSGKRVVISTGTKNLQEQLYFKDVPFLEQHFSRPLRVTYMKGRANYACRQKIYDAEKEPVLAGLEEVADFQIIREWEKTTGTGDRTEIRALPAASSAWAKLDARGELCTGQKCKQFDRCFITQMQMRARESDIVIVNHHLFFADMAVKEQEFGGIIPPYQAVIFDEAHELESVAGQYFGAGISSFQVEELRRDTAALARRKNAGTAGLDRTLIAVEDAARGFFALFPEAEGSHNVPDRHGFRQTIERGYHGLMGALELLRTDIELMQGAPDEFAPLARRAQELRDRLQFWVESGDPGYVHWIQRRSRSVSLEATPIDVSHLLTPRLFERVDTVVLTSATLAVAGSFDYVKSRLGVGTCRTLIVPGYFDYARQAMLYVPRQLPDPRDAGFLPAACDEVARILNVTGGRAFVLFTSYQQMRQFHDRLSFEIGYPVLLQGTGPNNALLEEFRATPQCVLFATAAFWQGVDVPGDQLSCVIVDRLPFAVPTDPVVQARVRATREAGGNPFFDYQVPEAVIALKQAFGRLIRSRADRGLLAILDNRIVKQRYGQMFFDSLPDYAFTMEFEEAAGWFRAGETRTDPRQLAPAP